MAVVTDAKSARPARERRGWIAAAVVLTLLALPLLPLLAPAGIVRLGGCTFAARFEQAPHYGADGPAGATGQRDLGVFAYHIWVGRTCYRAVWLSPEGSAKWLL